MVEGREQKDKTGSLEHLGCLCRAEVDGNAERFVEVRTPCLAGYGSVSMFCDGKAACGSHQCSHGADVKGPLTIAPGAAGVGDYQVNPERKDGLLSL